MTPRYLLDTHACLRLIGHGPGALRPLFAVCTPGEIAISSLTLAALRARARSSRAPEQNRQALDQFVLPLAVVDFDAEAARLLGTLATEAEVLGRTPGQEEMIAAQVLRLSATLVTSRPDLYAGLPGLALHAVPAVPAEAPHTRLDVLRLPAAQPPAPAVLSATDMPVARRIRVAGSHDFTLDLLAAWLHAADPALTLTLDSVGSLRGLLALQNGAADLAPSHLLDEETGDFNRGYIQHLLVPLGIRVLLVGFVEREQGLIVRKGNPKAIYVLPDLTRPDVSFVNRQRGAGTRVLLDYHLRRQGVAAEKIRGYGHEQPTHLAAAAAVADGRADCGLGVLAAARALDLDFVPLFHERFDLVVPQALYTAPLLAPLLALLRNPQAGFVQQIAALGGYATGLMGKVLEEL